MIEENTNNQSNNASSIKNSFGYTSYIFVPNSIQEVSQLKAAEFYPLTVNQIHGINFAYNQIGHYSQTGSYVQLVQPLPVNSTYIPTTQTQYNFQFPLPTQKIQIQNNLNNSRKHIEIRDPSTNEVVALNKLVERAKYKDKAANQKDVSFHDQAIEKDFKNEVLETSNSVLNQKIETEIPEDNNSFEKVETPEFEISVDSFEKNHNELSNGSSATFEQKTGETQIINENSKESNVQSKRRYDQNFLLSLKEKNSKIPLGMLRLPKCILNDTRTDDEKCFDDVRLILNKLAPDNFERLISQLIDLQINSSVERLNGTIDIIFEKSITEPGFSETYANLCKKLGSIEVANSTKSGEKVKFNHLLLQKCQKVFDSDYHQAINYEEKAAIDKINDEKIKCEKKELLDYKLRKAKRSYLGNIRFIGELFKLKILNENIMHDCIQRLLSEPDEESLESLCKLLTTIGSAIDNEKSAIKMKRCFDELKSISKSKSCQSVSFRIRFMIMDLIDLRTNGWVPRNGNVKNIPKKREDIHREYKEEEIKKQNEMAKLQAEKRYDNRFRKTSNQRDQQSKQENNLNQPRLRNIEFRNLTSINTEQIFKPAYFNKTKTQNGLVDNSNFTTNLSDSSNVKQNNKKIYKSDEIERKVINMVEEYIQNNDINEALKDFEEFKPTDPKQIEEFVCTAAKSVLEKSECARKSLGELFYHALKTNKLDLKRFTSGLMEIFSSAEDMAIDIPHVCKYLGELISPLVQEDFNIKFLNELFAPIYSDKTIRSIITEILHSALDRLDQEKVERIFRTSLVNININEYLKQ